MVVLVQECFRTLGPATCRRRGAARISCCASSPSPTRVPPPEQPPASRTTLGGSTLLRTSSSGQTNAEAGEITSIARLAAEGVPGVALALGPEGLRGRTPGKQRPARFNELAAAVPQMSRRMLSERLQELQDAGIVERHVEEGPAGRNVRADASAVRGCGPPWMRYGSGRVHRRPPRGRHCHTLRRHTDLRRRPVSADMVDHHNTKTRSSIARQVSMCPPGGAGMFCYPRRRLPLFLQLRRHVQALRSQDVLPCRPAVPLWCPPSRSADSHRFAAIRWPYTSMVIAAEKCCRTA
jgi:hypothetical protein